MTVALFLAGIAFIGICLAAWLLACHLCTTCWHDWVVIDYKRESEVRYEVDLLDGGPTKRALPFSAMSGEDYFETRVCVKCGTVDDQIARRKQQRVIELREEELRKSKAEDIYNRNSAMATNRNYREAKRIVEEVEERA